MTKPTLSRWLTENVADTRTPDGPDFRLYAAPFADAWDSLLNLIHQRRGWKLVHADEELGLMTVMCAAPVLRFRDDLTIWVSLDENGLTRVEARSESRVGKGDLGVNRRRIERLLQRLDGTVGPAVRSGR
jgi:uncharacterized protein (DUF1499 family)